MCLAFVSRSSRVCEAFRSIPVLFGRDLRAYPKTPLYFRRLGDLWVAAFEACGWWAQVHWIEAVFAGICGSSVLLRPF